MAEFGYVAKNANGEEVRSSIQAPSRYEALSELRAKGLTVVSLSEVGVSPPEPTEAPRETKQTKHRPSSMRRSRISLGEKAVFCRQLSISINSGLPLRAALEAITEDMENPAFKQSLELVVKRLHEGEPFSGAIDGQPKVFDRLFVALIRAAEEAGSLPQTLDHLSSALERAERLGRKVRSITTYPIFVAAFFGAACVVMTLFVLPQFESEFKNLGADLPVLTRIVFSFNGWVIDHIVLVVLFVAAVVAGIVFYGRTDAGRMRYDRLALRIPVIGDSIRKFSIARFSRNLAMMMRGGVPVATAIEISSATCGNRVLERAVMDARGRIMDGYDISSSLRIENEFPRLLVRMVGVGESSGRLPEVLERVADMYEDQVEGSIMVITSLFEPVIICIFGVVILVLVLAIYIPVFTVASHAG